MKEITLSIFCLFILFFFVECQSNKKVDITPHTVNLEADVFYQKVLFSFLLQYQIMPQVRLIKEKKEVVQIKQVKQKLKLKIVELWSKQELIVYKNQKV